MIRFIHVIASGLLGLTLFAPASASLAVARPPIGSTATDAAPSSTDLAVTHHSVTINGQMVHYTATAGYMTMNDYEGKPKANVFYVAYTKDSGPPTSTSDGVGKDTAGTVAPSDAPATDTTGTVVPPKVPDAIDPAARPITFAFNGGPGSSSVWLHLGALGPKRVVMNSEGFPLPPPYSLVDNEESWLDVTDLVFIDPVSTGYSRPVDGEPARQFHGLDEDISSVGDFIRVYTTKNTRWASPKYLAGESYGTTRAAGLSGYLQDTFGMYLNGIFLISPVLNFATIRGAAGNDLTFPMFLPTFTATAWYHKKLAPDLQADLSRAVAESRDFATNEYFTILAKGDALTPSEKDAAVKKLARLTGLSETHIRGSNLRVNEFNFMKELLRDQGYNVGRLDSRFKGIDSNNVGDGPDFDPSMAAITGPYSACLNDYVRRGLQYENDKVYEILTGRVQPWSYASSQNRYVNVAETLRSAMTKNQHLRVFVACGYYDLATPIGGAEYTVSHLNLHESLRANVSTYYYEAGHMMYIRLADLAKLKRDVREWMNAGVKK